MTQPVIDDVAHEQFAVSVEGATAKLEYELDGGRLLLLHTEVPEAFRGQGVDLLRCPARLGHPPGRECL